VVGAPTVLEFLVIIFSVCLVLLSLFLQCFDTVGWAAGRASGL